MRKLTYFILLLSQSILSQQQIFENDYYKMIIDNENFKMYNKNFTDDEVVVKRRSDCDLLAKGMIKKDSLNFYYLDSDSLVDYEFNVVKSNFSKGKEDVSVKLYIKGLTKIDLDNFEIDVLSGSNLKFESDIDGTTISFTLSKTKSNIDVYLYPNNKNKLLSEDAYGYSYPSTLIFPLLNFSRGFVKENEYEIIIDNFNACDLYLRFFIKEYVKITNFNLYWKDEILVRHN